MKLKWWHLAIVAFFSLAILGKLFEAMGLVPKLEERQASAQSQPTGAMYMGGIVAIDMANAGGEKPTSARVNALARAAATKSEVHEPADRSRFVRDFEFGFWQGWKTANR
jgi:hypothetical protein